MNFQFLKMNMKKNWNLSYQSIILKRIWVKFGIFLREIEKEIGNKLR